MTDERLGPYEVVARRLDGAVERLLAEISCADGSAAGGAGAHRSGGGRAPGGGGVADRRRALRRRVDGGASTGERSSVVAEVAALATADHAHVARVLDLFADTEGRLVVVLCETGGVSVRTWCRARPRPEPGEIVTIVVPVLAALLHLARRGVPVRSVTLDDVDIDERGAPVIVGLRAAGVVDDALPASTRAGVDFCRQVAEATAPGRPGPRGSGIAADSSWPPGSVTDLDELIEATLDLAVPLALSSVDPECPDVSGSSPAGVGDEIDGGGVPGWLAVLPESAIVDRLLTAWRSSGHGLPATLRSVRTRVWVAAGGVLIACLVALVIAPTRDTSADDVPEQAGVDAVATPGSVPPASSTEQPGVDRSRDEAADERSDPAGDAVVGNDPVAAARVLLAARADCVREPTASCLSLVDHAGSPLASLDGELLDDPGRAGQSTAGPFDVTGEASRLGGSVVLPAVGPNDEPASVVMVKTEAGWRLREISARL